MTKIADQFSILDDLAFIGVFTYLGLNFNYPEILDGDAYQVLPKLVGRSDYLLL